MLHRRGRLLPLLPAALVAAGCAGGMAPSVEALAQPAYPTIGYIERLSPELDAVVPRGAQIEVLANELEWAEGPLWLPEQQALLASDVKTNRIYRWSEDDGVSVYLEPSGFTGTVTDSRERGSNGLTLDADGRLVMSQHGDRRVARMAAPVDAPAPVFETLASRYEGRRFNSPNDLVFDRAGNLYFTDPPFGLSELIFDDPKKELPFQGVYRISVDGTLTLLTDAVTAPNGLAFSPDEGTLYVANTSERNAVWYAFPIAGDGSLGAPEVVHDATDLIGKEVGFPDGIKVDPAGNIFTAGPGGLWIFNAEHELIGKIRPGAWVSNCAFDEDYETLFITADDMLLRVRLR